MATHIPNTPPGVNEPGLPADIPCIPHSLTFGQEFLRLMALNRRTEARLNELLEIYPSPRLLHSRRARTLPGVLLFDGGNDAS